MALHLMQVPHPSGSGRPQLRLLCGYENGSVKMWAYIREDRDVSVQGVGWEMLWSVKRHVESGASACFHTCTVRVSVRLTITMGQSWLSRCRPTARSHSRSQRTT